MLEFLTRPVWAKDLEKIMFICKFRNISWEETIKMKSTHSSFYQLDLYLVKSLPTVSGGRIEGAGQGLDNSCRNDPILVISTLGSAVWFLSLQAAGTQMLGLYRWRFWWTSLCLPSPACAGRVGEIIKAESRLLRPGATAAAGRRWQAAELESCRRREERAHSLSCVQGWSAYRTGFGKLD